MKNKEKAPFQEKEIALAFIDVLGFADKVQNIGLEEIYNKYVELIESISPTFPSMGTAMRIVPGLGTVASIGLFDDKIKYAFFSDTILLWIEYDYEMMQIFERAINDFICKGLQMGLLLRGTLSYGMAHFDRESGIFLGKPLVEAAKGELLQDWVGITVGMSVNSNKMYSFWCYEPKHLIDYDRHFKADKQIQIQKLLTNLVFDWPRTWREKYSEIDLIKTLENLSNNAPDIAKIKYTNTIDFVKYSNNNQQWWAKLQKVEYDDFSDDIKEKLENGRPLQT
jgi:hypothetical protein